MRDGFLPFALPSIGEAEINEVAESLRSGWITTGPKTHEFAERFAAACGVSFALPVNSCTAALHLSLLAMGVGPGDEVITTPLTFCATANVICHTGATPVFADIDEESMNIDPAAFAKAITNKTKAVIPVHYAGQPCAMDEIMETARLKGLRVIEDAAHAPFAEYKGAVIGGIGDTTCFSFYATKNLTTSEGGMLTTNDKSIYDSAAVLSLHGMSRDAWDRYSEKGTWYYEVVAPGYKYNMFDIQAAMGLRQLDRHGEMQSRRDEIAASYSKALGGCPALKVPRAGDDVRHVWHLYPLRLRPNTLSIGRAGFIDELRTRKIGTSVHFIPVHLHPYYRDRFGFKPGDFPNAEAAYEAEISLPIYPMMNDADVQDVIEAVLEVAEEYKA